MLLTGIALLAGCGKKSVKKEEAETIRVYLWTTNLYDKYAPYSYKEVREKVKALGQEYTKKQYTIQISVFAIASAVISYLYFYKQHQ